MLDAVEAAAQHQQRHDDGGRGDARVAAQTEQLEAGRDAGELGAGRADVGHDEHGEGGAPDPHAVALADEADEPLAGDDAHAGGEAVEHHQGDGGEQEHPQQLVAVLGAEHRVGGDPGRVVVGEAGEQPRAHDRHQCPEREPFPPRAPHVTSPAVPAGRRRW